MTLARRLTFHLIALGVSLAALATATLWGLAGLSRSVSTARDEYRELRMIQNAESHVLAAWTGMSDAAATTRSVADEFRRASDLLGDFLAFQESQHLVPEAHQARESEYAKQARATLAPIIDALSREQTLPETPAERQALIAAAVDASDDLVEAARQMDHIISDTYADSKAKLRSTILLSASLVLLMVVGAILLSVSLHRSVMWPLKRLREGVRRFASGSFEQRIDATGDIEFRELAEDFNRTASELADLYADLEAKVAAKSRELVRSERLASVGFLAAGVAHEINNPLNIISGHAELALGQTASPEQKGPAKIDRDSLRIIRDEAFRCKEIIEKLLSLTRMGNGSRQPVQVSHVAGEVVSMLRGLKRYHTRRISLEVPAPDEPPVFANESEVKQVLLNLAVNALESTDPREGEVRIVVRETDGMIEIAIRDNGCGMDAATLDRVFEPFFTDRRSGRSEGVGLGLSISRAIVESYGGAIVAESEGPGAGSTFRIRVPAPAREPSHAHP
ncbi:MAG: ATP-binding protein [Phycisphaerae bacterium]